MSSHHVVREKQEPALLVLGLDNFDDELLGQLLEWSPTVIATPQTAEKLLSYGIKIDWLITNGTTEIEQSDVKLMHITDSNLVYAALQHLTGYGYPAVNIIANEFRFHDYTPFVSQINLVILNGNQRIFPITSGFSKWKPAGEIIWLLKPVTGLETSGLEQIDESRFQTIADGIFSLHFQEPFVFIGEQL
ncbi:MAG TPA: thiamine pyrophosphokinase [Mucilaginibacter sp.]